MRKFILIFKLFLSLVSVSFLFAQDQDALQNEICALKSVKTLPHFIPYSCEAANGKIQIGYPVFSKEQEKEHKLKNANLAKQAEKAKKDITQLLNKKKFKLEWTQRKDKIKIQEQEFEGIMLECSFVKIISLSDVEQEKKRIQAEKAEFDKQKEEWKKKAEAQEKAWQEFQKTPYFFNFNAKLAGAKFIHPEGSLTFLSETQVKYQKGEEYQTYDIIKRGKAGLELGGYRKFIECWSDNVFHFDGGTFYKSGYQPSGKLAGKSFSEYALRTSFLKSYGADKAVSPISNNDFDFGDIIENHRPETEIHREYSFLPEGRVKVTQYQYSGAPNIRAIEDSYEKIMDEIDYKLRELERQRNQSFFSILSQSEKERILKPLLESLQNYSIKPFEIPCFIVSEDAQSYSWKEGKLEGQKVIKLVNTYNSSENRTFLYTGNFSLGRLKMSQYGTYYISSEGSLYLMK